MSATTVDTQAGTGILQDITGPEDLRHLDTADLRRLAEEIRERLVDTVCRTGGHLGPNLGVVELTVALHRVFDSPRTPIIFDTGHQAYVHKLLTGRQEEFDRLRQADGLAGYPRRSESAHDVVENSHASTGLAYADGLARALALRGESHRPVVVVVGDGALTGGAAWEGLNNLGGTDRRVVIVLNDNGRSYAPTVGAAARHLGRIRDRAGYADVQRSLGGTSLPSAPSTAGGLFDAVGLPYVGPVDGHDLGALEEALVRARDASGPVVVHCLTRKGQGYRPAEEDQADRFHAIGVVDPATGAARRSGGRQWTDVFSGELVSLAEDRPDVVAVGAAMLGPTGLQPFADRHPERCFDVGIAEQHALTSAAGLAMGGMHPVVALYATFANRAFDQLLLDVALHELPVTLVLDRAGVTGPDGPSHHGMWDLVLLGTVPGMRVAAPRDAQALAGQLAEAVATDTGPTALRFPKGSVPPPVAALGRVGEMELLRAPDAADVLLVSVGAMAGPALGAAEMLAHLGVECTVVDPRWVLPPPAGLADLAAGHRVVVVVEDGVRDGGVGSRVALALTDHGVRVPVRCLGLPARFLPHGAREELLAGAGLDAHGIAASVKEALGEPLDARPDAASASAGRRS